MYIYVLCPIIAFALAQGAKIILRSFKRKIGWHDLFAYSDMPSGHTSVVVAIASILAFRLGVSSPEFAVAFVFATITIVDAIGLRNYLGQHGRALNVMVQDLKEDEFLDRRYPKQLEKIGHTPLQVLVGGLIGFLTSLLGHLFF